MTTRRILAVSDIHGYGHLLKKLLEHAGYRPGEDRLYLLGDYVNKGPDSVGTLRYVETLCKQGATALLGNNELQWMQSREREIVPWHSFLHTLPLWAEDGPYIFVHAGVRPGVPMKQQQLEDLTDIDREVVVRTVMPDRTIVFGHSPTFRLGAEPGFVWQAHGKLGIDTGAGHGLCLSLVDLNAGIVYASHTHEEAEVRKYAIPLTEGGKRYVGN